MRPTRFLFVPFTCVMLAMASTGSTGSAQSAGGTAAGTDSSNSTSKVPSDDSVVSSEMRKLELAFGGVWTTSETFARNGFYPNGAERKGTAQFRLVTGGTSLIEEVHSDGSAGRLDFMVVIWWDSGAKIYKVFTCGNGGSDPCGIRGIAYFDGDSFANDYGLKIRGAKKKMEGHLLGDHSAVLNCATSRAPADWRFHVFRSHRPFAIR
jgi:hypothetical protein